MSQSTKTTPAVEGAVTPIRKYTAGQIIQDAARVGILASVMMPPRWAQEIVSADDHVIHRARFSTAGVQFSIDRWLTNGEPASIDAHFSWTSKHGESEEFVVDADRIPDIIAALSAAQNLVEAEVTA